MSGFAAISRGMLDHPLFDGDSARAGAWLWIVLRACWKPTPFDIGGKMVTLQRGQLCASRSQMAKAWGWSDSAVERFLARLKTEQMIERETGQGKTIITVCNYAKYQDVSEKTGQTAEQDTGQRPDSDRTAKEPFNQETSLEDTPLPPVGEAEPVLIDEPAKPDPVAELVETWNEIAGIHGLPAVRTLSDTRRRKAAKRIAEHGLDEMRECVGRIACSPFLSGKKTDFRADFDFLVNPSKLTRLQEGFYDERGHDPPQPPNYRPPNRNAGGIIGQFAQGLRA
jgi:hypothetical protein